MSRTKFTEEQQIAAHKQRVLNCLLRFGALPVSRIVKHVGISYEHSHFCLNELLQDKQIVRRERINPINRQVIQEYSISTPGQLKN